MKYIPGLNGLRAFAVFFVIITHWVPENDKQNFFFKLLPDGRFGVNLFFVLSGFLISTILFIEKKKLSENNTKKKVIVNFYIRRFLRIFPVYYLTIFLVFIFSQTEFNKDIAYYLTYSSNYIIYFRKSYGIMGHTWSLAVEEQFYLIWPFIIIFLARNKIRWVLFFFILLGPLSSFVQTYFFKSSFNAYILTPECLDSFAIGGVLAHYYSENQLRMLKKWIKLLLPLSLFLFYYWRFSKDGGHFQFVRRTIESVIASSLVLFCLSSFWVKARDFLLENTVIKQLGIVSYGIYLFHYSLPYFYLKAKSTFSTDQNLSFSFIDNAVLTILLLALAFTSYYFIEKPILSLKERFKY